MNDTDLCSGLFCPLKFSCRRYLSIPLQTPKKKLLWWVDPAYDKKTDKCKLYLKQRKS